MPNSALLDYISKSKTAHLSNEQIIQNLHQAGWPEQDIHQALLQNVNPPNPNSPTLQTNKFIQILNLEYNNLPGILIRVGLAFVFLYASFFVSTVDSGAKYVPSLISNIIPLATFLELFGVFEIILAVWLLSGYLVKYSSLVTAFLLIGITFSNLSYFPILFRNIAIICAALALFSLKVLQDKGNSE